MSIQPLRATRSASPNRIEWENTLIDKLKNVVIRCLAIVVGALLLTAFALWDLKKKVQQTLSSHSNPKMVKWLRFNPYKELPRTPTAFLQKAIFIFESSLPKEKRETFKSELEMASNIHTTVALAVLKAYVFSEIEPNFCFFKSKELVQFRALFNKLSPLEVEFFLQKTDLENIGEIKLFKNVPSLCFNLHRDKSFLGCLKNFLK